VCFTLAFCLLFLSVWRSVCDVCRLSALFPSLLFSDATGAV
jgi:hypothetical protein